MKATTTLSHEGYVQAVRQAAIERGLESGRITPEEAAKMAAVKLVYGTGYRGGYRGATFYGTWNAGEAPTDTVEIAAAGQENWVQLGCTTIHEFAHVLAGSGAGHSADWKAYTVRLGLRAAKAAGTTYHLASIADPILRARMADLAQRVTDGSPAWRTGSPMAGGLAAILAGAMARPCSAGIGTRGGRSRGVGSGSRLLRASCETCGYTVRVTAKWLAVSMPHCGQGHGPMLQG